MCHTPWRPFTRYRATWVGNNKEHCFYAIAVVTWGLILTSPESIIIIRQLNPTKMLQCNRLMSKKRASDGNWTQIDIFTSWSSQKCIVYYCLLSLPYIIYTGLPEQCSFFMSCFGKWEECDVGLSVALKAVAMCLRAFSWPRY